jgi:hypothetical protein
MSGIFDEASAAAQARAASAAGTIAGAPRPAGEGASNSAPAAPSERTDPYAIAAEKFPWLLEGASRREPGSKLTQLAVNDNRGFVQGIQSHDVDSTSNGKRLGYMKQEGDGESKSEAAQTPRYAQLSEQKPTVFAPKREASFPSSKDVEDATKHDYSYADPMAGYFKAGGASVRTRPLEEVMQILRKNSQAKSLDEVEEIDGMPTPTDEQISKILLRTWLATRNNPLAALGFDPRRMVISLSDRPSFAAGQYMGHPRSEPLPPRGTPPRFDTLWFNSYFATTPVHESIHRGLKRLELEGELPFDVTQEEEEWIVRAVMQKYYGDVEVGRGVGSDRQIEEEKKVVTPEVLDIIERKAYELYLRDLKLNPKIKGPR